MQRQFAPSDISILDNAITLDEQAKQEDQSYSKLTPGGNQLFMAV